jgi:pimeloyl-ACP methyl ester carboxylesterase
MPYATADDGVRLYYEEAGSGTPIIFAHEFAGDLRSWEPQLRHFSHHYRAIAYCARGYPPSDVLEAVASYSQDRARDDIVAILDHLGIDRAHVVGVSMGGFASLHVGLYRPGRARSCVVAGAGYGAAPDEREKFRAECEAVARVFEAQGTPAAAERYTLGPTRVQFQNKDPRGWAEFARQMAEHSARGSANTLRGYQMARPSLWDLAEDMRRSTVPMLIVTGDEDDPCLEPALFMKRNIPTAGIWMCPQSGHTLNLEEPDAFNRALGEFFVAVDNGRWMARDPRSVAGGIIGFTK